MHQRRQNAEEWILLWIRKDALPPQDARRSFARCLGEATERNLKTVAGLCLPGTFRAKQVSIAFRHAKYVALLHASMGAAYVNIQVTLENSIDHDKFGLRHFRYGKRRNFKTSNVR
jgi:hypothetical protein